MKKSAICPSPYKIKNAFTLIELLVVLAILGTIAALLLPTIGSAIEAGHRAKCASNLRQLGIAFHIYIDDWDGKFPPLSRPLIGPTEYWYDIINGYVDDINVWKCPDYTLNDNLIGNQQSYAYNFGLGFGPRTIRDIQQPSKHVMIADSGNTAPVWSYCNHRLTRTGWGGSSPPGDRHNDGANVLFVDGHVAWYLQDFLTAVQPEIVW